MDKKRKKPLDYVISALIVLLVVIFAVSISRLFSARREYDVGSETYETLTQTVVTPVKPKHAPVPEQPADEPVEVSAEPEAEPTPYVPLLDVNFDALLEMNADTVAWIHMPGALDYPVVQGKNNDYYLTHLIDGTYNQNGSIFMDCRNDPDLTNRNTYIYGHNMGNGTMFAVLLKYSTPGFYEENRELILVTPDASYYLQPFSGYVTSSSSGAYQWSFQDDNAYSTYLQEIMVCSEFVSDVEVTSEDRIVTLSTCSYAFDDARYVLHCKLVPAD